MEREVLGVTVRFGSGCAQSVLYAMTDQETGETRCTLGLTDPSGRLHMRKDLLSFAVPYKLYKRMDSDLDESFLTTGKFRLNMDKCI